MVMSTSMRFLTLALVLGCATTALQNSPGDTDDMRDIMSANARWDSASVKRDPVMLGELMADEFIHVNERGGVGTRLGVIQSLSANRGFGYAMHRSDSVTIKLHGTTAIMHGIVVRKGDEGRPQDTGTFRMTRVWVKQPSGWQVAANHYSLMSAPAAR